MSDQVGFQLNFDVTGLQANAVSSHEHEFYVDVEQNFSRGTYDQSDVTLVLYMGDVEFRLQGKDDHLIRIARHIDSYLCSVTGKDLWGNEFTPPEPDVNPNDEENDLS